MDHSKAIASLLALLLLGGCASLRWSVLRAFRAPGEHLAALPEQIWDEYDCDSQHRPFFLVEKNELIPNRVEAGGEFGHRLVYVMCPARPTEVVRGRLATRIRFRGAPLMVEMDRHYEIKPGRWIVDAFVTLSRFLQTCRKVDVRGFVEAGTKLDHHGNLLARACRVEQRFDER